MENSILFLGKFHDDLLSLEAKIILLDIKKLRKKQDSLQFPDVIKYPKRKKNNYDSWIILGDVKPTLLLKDLITKVKIILLVFNLSKSLRNETLDFLNEGWGPIFKKIPKDQNKQLRFLVGLQSPEDIYQDENILKQIRSTMKKFGCTQYFDDKISKDITKKDFTIYSNLQKNLIKSKFKKSSSTIQRSYDNHNDDDDDDNDNDYSLKYEEDEEEKDQISSIKNDKKLRKSDTVKARSFTDDKLVNYELFKKNKRKIARIIESPNAKGNVVIPKTISYKSKIYFVRKICDNAFSNTKELESLSFDKDSKVVKIGSSVFLNSNIKKFSIPSNDVIFDHFWCNGADNLKVIEVNEKIKNYSILEKCLICTKNRIENDEEINVLSKIILFVPRNFEGDFILPENITRIAHYSFSHCNKLISFKSENRTLKTINSFAFEGCKNLKSIVIKNANDLILGNSCFANSEKLESAEFQCKKLVIGENCFSNCPCFNSISFENVKQIKYRPKEFRKSSSLTKMLDNETSKTIEFMPDFVKKSSSLKSFVISSQEDIIITEDIFEGCKSLKEIKLMSCSKLALECPCFNNTNIETIEIIGETLELNYDCFINCKKLQTLKIQSGSKIELNDSKSFANNSLKKLNLFSRFESDSIVKLLNGFNDEMKKLEVVSITAEKVFVGKNCFRKSSIKEFNVISSKEVTLEKSAFKNCEKFEKVKIKATSKTIIGDNCFKNCSLLKSIEIPENAIYPNNAFEDVPDK